MSREVRWLFAGLGSLFWGGLFLSAAIMNAREGTPVANLVWTYVFQLLILTLLVVPYLVLVREIVSGGVAWGLAVALLAIHGSFATVFFLTVPGGHGLEAFYILYAAVLGAVASAVAKAIDRRVPLGKH